MATASILVPVFYLAIIQFFGSWHFWREMVVILAYFVAMLCWLRKASARLRIYLVLGSTLRYYDEIGLLKALSGYRLYGKKEVDILQQILIYREVGFPLDEIKSIIYAVDFDLEQSFKHHLTELCNKRRRLDVLISNVAKSMLSRSEQKNGSHFHLVEHHKKDGEKNVSRETFSPPVLHRCKEGPLFHLGRRALRIFRSGRGASAGSQPGAGEQQHTVFDKLLCFALQSHPRRSGCLKKF